MSAGVDHVGPHWQCRQTSADVGPCQPTSANVSHVGQCWPMSADLSQKSANVGQCRPRMAKGPMGAGGGQIGQCRQVSANVGPCLPMQATASKYRPMSAHVVKYRPLSENVGRCWPISLSGSSFGRCVTTGAQGPALTRPFSLNLRPLCNWPREAVVPQSDGLSYMVKHCVLSESPLISYHFG